MKDKIAKELVRSLDNIRAKLSEIESVLNDIRLYGIRQKGTVDCQFTGCHRKVKEDYFEK